jgi:hypothetical protein
MPYVLSHSFFPCTSAGWSSKCIFVTVDEARRYAVSTHCNLFCIAMKYRFFLCWKNIVYENKVPREIHISTSDD